MVETSLLLKDEPLPLLTLNIDKVMGVWIFKRRVQNTKISKKWTSWFWIYLLLTWEGRNPFRTFYPRTMEAPALHRVKGSDLKILSRTTLVKFPKIGTAHFTGKSGPMHFVLVVWQPKRNMSGPTRLQRHTFITMYDTGAFLTIRDPIPSSNP